jgi:hypothetical protein
MTKDRALDLARACIRIDRDGKMRLNVGRIARLLAERGVQRPMEVIEADLRNRAGARGLAAYILDPFVQLELPGLRIE